MLLYLRLGKELKQCMIFNALLLYYDLALYNTMYYIHYHIITLRSSTVFKAPAQYYSDVEFCYCPTDTWATRVFSTRVFCLSIIFATTTGLFFLLHFGGTFVYFALNKNLTRVFSTENYHFVNLNLNFQFTNISQNCNKQKLSIF
jgi:hypothetical protein